MLLVSSLPPLARVKGEISRLRGEAIDLAFTLEESLAKLVLGGVLERSEALLRAAHPEELESLLR